MPAFTFNEAHINDHDWDYSKVVKTITAPTLEQAIIEFEDVGDIMACGDVKQRFDVQVTETDIPYYDNDEYTIFIEQSDEPDVTVAASTFILLDRYQNTPPKTLSAEDAKDFTYGLDSLTNPTTGIKQYCAEEYDVIEIPNQ